MVNRLQKELHQTRPFESLGIEALLNISKTAAMIQFHVAQSLKPFGLSAEQYNALRIMKGAGPRGCTCQDIAQRLINRDPDVTRLVDKLVKKQLVTRGRDELDRRVVINRIAPKGETLLKRVKERMPDPSAEVLGHMSKRQLTDLINLLELTREGFE